MLRPLPPHALLVSVLAAALGCPAAAVDGVLEINQTCATLTGCFAGDAASFPVSIDQSGSYRLTGNLTLSDSNQTAIEIAASATDVSIDLNGFEIACPTCALPGSGYGIRALDPASRVALFRGSVRNLGGPGVLIPGRASIERVSASHCQGSGFSVGDGSSVANSAATANGTSGISGGNDCRISGNVATGNGGYGIVAGSCVVVRNTASGNAVGIGVTGGTVADNVVKANLGVGIAATGSIVRGNSVASNTGYGLEPVGATGYEGNVLLSNNGGNANPQVGAGGIELGSNVCGGDTTCP